MFRLQRTRARALALIQFCSDPNLTGYRDHWVMGHLFALVVLPAQRQRYLSSRRI